MAVLSSLSYQEFSSIIAQFDQRNFGIPIPKVAEERADRQLVLNQFHRSLPPKFPKDIINLIALASVNSVSELFMVYRTSPALIDRTRFLNTSDIVLDSAAKKVLRAYKKSLNPTELKMVKDLGYLPATEQTTLGHFNKLMTLVLKDHLNSLPIDDQLRLKYKTLSTENSSISTLRDEAGLNLKLILWKVQAVIGKISFTITHSLTASVLFTLCLSTVMIIGTLSVTAQVHKYVNKHADRFALFIFLNVQIPIFKKCVSILKLTIENHQTEFIFKIIFNITFIISSTLPFIATMPLLFAMSRAFILPAIFLINNWQVTMSPAAVYVKKADHLNDNFDHLVTKWHELCIKPHLLKA